MATYDTPWIERIYGIFDYFDGFIIDHQRDTAK